MVARTSFGEEARRAARENLRAGLLLLERGLLRGAANRFYYAAFQAAVYALEGQGRRPSEFRDPYWTDATVGHLAPLARYRPEDRLSFAWLYDLRLKADYLTGPVSRAELASARHEVRRFVEEVTS